MSHTPAPPLLPPPSADVRAEARARAERLALGLFPHQVAGVAFLLSRRRSILADDMGLGKTRQSIIAMTEAEPDGPWLVVSPASVKRNWAREIGIARPADDVRIVGPDAPPEPGYRGWAIINYDILERQFAELTKHEWRGLVFDESHYLKNHRTKRSTLARRLVEVAPDAVLHLLTGTPLTNRPRDLFVLLQLLGHPMATSFLSFAKRYCDATHNGFGWVTDGASNLEELRIQLHGIMLRRTKDEVLDLPPKLRSWLSVNVPAATGRAAMRRVLEMLLAPERHKTVQLLEMLTKAREDVAKAKVTSTIEFVEGALQQGEKVIVFSGFSDPVGKIAKHFGSAAVTFTGATPTAKRQSLVDRFQNDPETRVFVANIVAGGIGINLTAARQVVFNDLDWVPANHWQAEDRAYRIGQTGTVNVTYMVADGTIDDFVSQALEVKRNLIEAVVEGGDAELGGDLLQDLARLVGTLSPGIATLADGESGEDAVDRLLREVTAKVAAEERTASRRLSNATLPEDAILALARALIGSQLPVRYLAASSKGPAAGYTLDVSGGDVVCSCNGFQYRGACRHARDLKAALVDGGPLPPGIEQVVIPSERNESRNL